MTPFQLARWESLHSASGISSNQEAALKVVICASFWQHLYQDVLISSTRTVTTPLVTQTVGLFISKRDKMRRELHQSHPGGNRGVNIGGGTEGVKSFSDFFKTLLMEFWQWNNFYKNRITKYTNKPWHIVLYSQDHIDQAQVMDKTKTLQTKL